MNDHTPPMAGDDEHDPVLGAAGDRLRRDSSAISPDAVEVAVLRRRTRRVGLVASGCLALVAVLAGLLIVQGGDRTTTDATTVRPDVQDPDQVEQILRSLDDQPVDPTKVELLSSVATFPDCDALVGDLRRVGAEHVGSRGFGGFSDSIINQRSDGFSADSASQVALTSGPGGDDTTLGTNVQVAGVDELDYVKAVGSLIHDLDGKGNLRITDAETLQVLSTLDVTPPGPNRTKEDAGGYGPGGQTLVSQILVADGRVVIFGTELEVSPAVEGDPSATRAATEYMTVTFVDATDPAAPTVTDRVRVEGSLVAARLVDGQVRLVTTSHMADLGFVMPTTPNSVATALAQNRRSVASSTAPDWIPDWQRAGDDPQPLVPCDRVHVPDTFAGVAMTSMLTFPSGTGRFEPAGTSVLAPATTLYAGLDRVAISSEVWVDPIDRDRLEFDDWRTAVHEFGFGDDTAPTYTGSGIVDGSTIGQFAFGEIGESLAVVTTKGTPWQQDPEVGVDLTVLTADGDGGLSETSKVADLSNGKGAVSAVRFLDGRVLISSGSFGREVYVIDVTDPAEPRRAGSVTVPSTVGYFHPLPDQRALVVGSRFDEVGEGQNRQTRSWAQALLLDVSDADAPAVVSTWERPWAADQVGMDHHAFTYWPDRGLAMWGVENTQSRGDQPNNAVVLGVDAQVTEVAVPEASKPPETPSPCPTVEVTDPDAKRAIGPGGVVLRCDDAALREVEWPRYQCSYLDERTIAQFAPGQEVSGAFFLCSPTGSPTVGRVLVVAGRPMLLTDQTLEVLDSQTFASVSIAYHPSRGVSATY